MKSLRHILQVCEVSPIQPALEDVFISDIYLDSRNCTPKSLFCAYKGQMLDGHAFINNAIENGAIAILAEKDIKRCPVPVIQIPDLYNKLGTIAGEFYDQPSTQMTVIGVTGTNGKTSVSHFMGQCLSKLGKPSGFIGTVGYGTPDSLESTYCTTPSVFELRRILKNFTNNMLEAVTMEVSSHALIQQRTQDIHFDMAIFTNLTQDHLDYHSDMTSYAEAKAKLFASRHLKFAILNLDDPASETMREALHQNIAIMNYAVKDQTADVHLLDVEMKPRCMKANIRTLKGDIECTIPLIGSFNLDNVLAVIAGLLMFGYPLESIRLAIEELTPVEGRMEIIRNKDAATVIIDYAHTPDALEKALTSIRAHCKGQIISVFGCGGDRDLGKRPQMAAISEKLADHTIITQDNSRNEPVNSIFKDIKSGFELNNHEFIENRPKAIQTALAIAKPKDIILLAGKGHERYLDLKGKRIPFDERQIIAETLC